MISQCFAGTISTQEAEANMFFLMLVEVVIRKFSCMGFVFGFSKTKYPVKQQGGVGAKSSNEI